MALTIDTPYGHIPAAVSGTTTADPITGSYACSANTGALVVMIFYAAATQRTGGNPTYNGLEMTQAETLAGVTEAACEMWYMLDPPTGTYDVSIPNTNTRTAWVNIASISTSSGNTCEVDDTGINETTAANPTVQLVTTVSDFMAFACVATGDNTFNPTAQRGTKIYNDDPAAYGSASQYLSGSATGTLNMNWTEATSDDYGAIAIAFKEVAGVPSLVVANATQAQTSVKVTLTQNYLLQINSSAQTQTADKINLSQKYTLTIYTASQTQTADKITLIQNYSIQVNIASQAQTSDNVVLTAYEPPASITISSPTQTQSSDNVSLLQHYVLAINSVTQTQTTSDIILSASYGIVIYNSTQTQTANNIVLRAHRGLIFQAKNETGDFSEYTGKIDADNHLTNTEEAALGGTGRGLQWLIADSNYARAYKTYTPTNTSGTVRVRFYFDPNSLVMDASANCAISYASSTSANIHYYVFFERDAGNTKYRVWSNTETDTGMLQTSLYEISDEEHYIEVRTIRASANDTSDGSFTLWIDGIHKETINNIDNYDTLYDLWGVQLGYGINYLSASGTYFVDELVVRDDDVEIGPNIYVPVQNSLQLQTSNNVDLTQHNTINIQNAQQLQISVNIILVQNYILFMYSTTQIQEPGNIILSTGVIGVVIQMMHYIRLRSR